MPSPYTEFLQKQIDQVKKAKAETAFDKACATYGSQQAALKAYDCKTKEEAIAMLAVTQTCVYTNETGKSLLTKPGIYQI